MRSRKILMIFVYLLAWQTFATALNAYDQHKEWDECFKQPSMSGGIISACVKYTPTISSEELFSFIPLTWPYIFYKTHYFQYGFQYSDDDSDLDI